MTVYQGSGITRAQAAALLAPFTSAASFSPAPQTAAYLAAMTSPAPLGYALAYDRLIRALVAAGVYSLFDGFWIMAAHDRQAAKLNAAAPGTFTLAETNAPIFTPGQGFRGDSIQAAMDTGVTPNAGGAKAAQDNFAMGYWADDPGYSSPAGVWASGQDRLALTHGQGNFFSRGGLVGTVSTATAKTRMMLALTRNNSANHQTYLNGALLTSFVGASTLFGSGSINIFRRAGQTVFDGELIPFFYLGSALTEPQHLAIYNACRTYLADVGNPPA